MASKPPKTTSKAKPATAKKAAAKETGIAVAKPVLADVRAKIDQIDRSIQSLIAERAQFAHQVGKA
ncbi:MAG: chorismate mutase, partial [Stenotrophomonas nitritireducens]|nr:chorismate mutase [Stenotrophomonas nitritireducens]